MITQADLYSLMAQANHLKQLPRTGWLYAGIASPESVADHSYSVALLAMQLGSIINQDWQGEALNEPALSGPLELGMAVRMALVHDLAESVLTDLPKRSVDLIGKDVKSKSERAALERLVGSLPNAVTIMDLWQDYDNASTPEARLVKDADKLEMVFQAHCYEVQGHVNLSEFWHGHQWHYLSSRRFFQEIRSHRDRRKVDNEKDSSDDG